MINSIAGVLAILLIAAAPIGESGIAESQGEVLSSQQTQEQEAAEYYQYSGPIDINTGDPLADQEGNTSSSGSVVNLPDGSSYNRIDHTFNYIVPDQSLFVHSSVVNNVITTDMVSITADDGLDIILYKNSKPQTDMDLSRINIPGKYTVLAKGKETDYQVMTFTIVSKETGAIDSYKLPSGFVVTGVIYNGKDISNPDQGTVDLSQEGSYTIEYNCLATGITYELVLDIDHTEPGFKLTGVKDGKARGPVTITDVAEDETVSITSGDKEVRLPADMVIRNVGRYTVTVTDPAGNRRSESFTIRMYLNYQGIIFFMLSIGIIAAMITYMVVSRQKLRIR